MQVARRQHDEYQRLIGKGLSHDDASEQAAKLAKNLMEDPTQEMIEAAVDFGRYQTNTQPITGSILGRLDKVFNNPMLKVYMPFMRVVSNTFGAANERNPFTFFLTPRFWKNWNAGGVQRDLAMARVTMGAGWGYVITQATNNGYITGAGTFGSYKERQLAEAQGWQAYSFVYKKGSLTQTQIDRFKKLTDVSIGQDKIYVSYKGIEPISILLAQFASLAEFSYNNNASAEDVDLLFTAATLSTYDYMTEHPLMQTMGSIGELFSNKTQSADGLANMIEKLSETYTTYTLQGLPVPVPTTVKGERVWVGGPWSGFQADLERSFYPEKSATGPLEMRGERVDAVSEITNPAINGYNKAFASICAKTPNCSPNMPSTLDPITGKREENGLGNTYDLWGPFKTTKGLTPGAIYSDG